MRAILSVYDKGGLGDFANGLLKLGWELYSSGGTRRALEAQGLSVGSVEGLTGFPEILDGRVKTLHPALHGGILALRDKPSHMDELARQGIGPIDLVAVNLYPFLETVSREGVALEEALENIDIGGPTMVRAAAKNFPHVLVVVDPEDYPSVLDALRDGKADLAMRRRLAQKAFQHVAAYDTVVAQYLREGEELPDSLTIGMKKVQGLRYGENPHQQAAFYVALDPSASGGLTGVVTARQLQGKELSFNNIVDADAAWKAVCDFSAPTVAIIKHTNPCGLASHLDLSEAYLRAFSGDPVSAYGGIVAANRPIDVATAREIAPTFYEVLIAPAFDEEALAVLRRKRDLRILATGGLPPTGHAPTLEIRNVRGGFLLQTEDLLPDPTSDTLKTVTQREPTPKEREDLLFAWRVVKHVKSNAIVLTKDKTLVGMGAGQPNRVTSVMLAVRAAEERAMGSVLASDAFFPFPDGVEAAAAAGVTAIIQPGGSIRDEDSIQVCNEHHMAMVFTGVRHFRH